MMALVNLRLQISILICSLFQLINKPLDHKEPGVKVIRLISSTVPEDSIVNRCRQMLVMGLVLTSRFLGHQTMMILQDKVEEESANLRVLKLLGLKRLQLDTKKALVDPDLSNLYLLTLLAIN